MAAGADAREPDAGRRQLLPRAGRQTVRKFKLDVLRVRDGKIAEITTFDSSLFEQFGLPRRLGAGRLDDQVRDRHVELLAQPLDDPGSSQFDCFGGWVEIITSSAPGAAQLVLDRAQRDVRVPDPR